MTQHIHIKMTTEAKNHFPLLSIASRVLLIYHHTLYAKLSDLASIQHSTSNSYQTLFRGSNNAQDLRPFPPIDTGPSVGESAHHSKLVSSKRFDSRGLSTQPSSTRNSRDEARVIMLTNQHITTSSCQHAVHHLNRVQQCSDAPLILRPHVCTCLDKLVHHLLQHPDHIMVRTYQRRER